MAPPNSAWSGPGLAAGSPSGSRIPPRPIVERSTERQGGVRNDVTGNQGRFVHTDKGVPVPRANLENTAGGNLLVKVNPWWPF